MCYKSQWNGMECEKTPCKNVFLLKLEVDFFLSKRQPKLLYLFEFFRISDIPPHHSDEIQV